MKIGVISDIHSNLFYFKEVLNTLKEQSLDSIYCLGDLVGYYDQPNDVINLLRENNIICIKGNHDKYLINELSFDKDRDVFYRISEQRQEVSQNNKDYLKSLPDCLDIEILDKRFFMTHSLPSDTETYLNDINQLDREFLKDFDYYLYGHTHRCNLQYHYGTCVLNPGSVGQPRDYNASPSYAVIDLSRETISTYRVPVDTETYITKLGDLNLDERVVNNLRRGRLDS
tara:strand:+ start:28605 stop:29288 length:684 start_codon:yes stop_codon:yes gene_type:complete